MNCTYMIVRLTKDAEIRYSQGDKPTTIAKISVASDRDYKKDGEPTADFYNCIAFGKTAEVIEKYASTKGTQVALEGRFQNNNWTDKDEQKHFDIQFNIAKVTLIGGKQSSQHNNNENKTADDGFMNIPDGIEELPFS